MVIVDWKVVVLTVLASIVVFGAITLLVAWLRVLDGSLRASRASVLSYWVAPVAVLAAAFGLGLR